MSVFFQGTLKELATINQAAQFFIEQQVLIVNYAEQIIKYKGQENYITYRRSIFNEKEISNTVNGYALPTILNTKVKAAVKYMDQELTCWLRLNILPLKGFHVQFLQSLQWNRMAKVDVQKTIRPILQNEEIDVYKRFLLACRYFCKEEVIYLGNQLSEVNITDFRSTLHVGKLSKFWIYYLRNKLRPNYTADKLDNETYIMMVRDALIQKNTYIALYLWEKVNQESKATFIISNFRYFTDDFFDFILMETEFVRIEQFALQFLSASLNNWCWHEDFISHLNSYNQFIKTVEVNILFRQLFIKIEDYPTLDALRYLVRAFLKVFLSEISIESRHSFLKMLVKIEDEESCEIVLNDMSTLEIVNCLKKISLEFINLIVEDKYKFLDCLIHNIKSEDEITTFKTDFITRNGDFDILKLIRIGKTDEFIKVIEWATLSEETWMKYKTEVLLNEERFHLFKVLIYRNIEQLPKYLEFLYRRSGCLKSDMDLTMKELFVAKYAEKVFYSLLFDDEDTMDLALDIECTKPFMKFCFPDEEERSVAVKKFINKIGEVYGFYLLYYNKCKVLDQVLDCCFFNNADEKADYKKNTSLIQVTLLN